MEWWLLTFIISAILSLFLPIVPDFSLLLAILLFSLLLIFIKNFRVVAIAIFACAWILTAASQYQSRLAHNNIAPEQLHKQVHLVQGTVANIVDNQSRASRFNFLVSHWQGEKLSEPFMLRLSWQAPKQGARQTLLQGQTWQLAVKVKPAHGLANIGGFNYQLWLLQKQIVATGYVKADVLSQDQATAKSPKLLKKRNVLLNAQPTWRQNLYQKLTNLLTDKALGALIFALGFGERGELTPQHWQVLSATATQHLIAISGLHIGIIAVASLLFMRVFIRLLPLNWLLSSRWQLTLMRLNLRSLPVVFSCSVAWYYAYLAGFSIPTLRALVMLLLFWSIKLITINTTLLRWFLVAIFIILLLWPLSLLSVSFWLSISALVIIFATLSRFSMRAVTVIAEDDEVSKPPETFAEKYWYMFKARASLWFKTLLVMQLALTLMMLPIAALLNYQLPLAAFLANIVAVPLMSVSVIPLTLFAVIALPFSTGVAGSVVDLALFFLDFIWQWLSYLTSAQWALIAVSYQQIQIMLVAFVVIALALFFRPDRAKSVAIACLAVVAIAVGMLSREPEKAWQLSVLDVGHGLAIVIEKNRQVFIYDTGASYPSGFNMADAALLPYLKHQGYSAIDGVIISHNDNDHAGGLGHLREELLVNKVIANDFALSPDEHCLAGQGFTWQGLSFDILSPEQILGDKNDDSCVVVISDGRHKVLLPGDISKKQERRLLNAEQTSLKLVSDILIAPHHGSKSSSSQRFLTQVAPRYAVFSAGYLNRWQMPSKETRDRYQALNITTLNTADVGMVTFRFGQVRENDVVKKDINVNNYRQHMRPFWFIK
ncbi:MAG: DNA internalization-related competence protein ComEC/Rec2 [Cognaticolwellia sp.]